MIQKRGLAKAELATIIFAATVLVLFLMVVTAKVSDLKRDSDDALCTLSIETHSKANDAFQGFVDTGLECPAHHEKIKVSTQNELDIKIIDDLKRCWTKTKGRGNRLWEGGLFSEDDDYCIVCSSFTIYEKGKIKDNVSTQEIGDHMTKRDPETNRPYMDSLMTDWYSNDNSHYFINARKEKDDDVVIEPLRELQVSDKDEEHKYLVTYMAYSDHGYLGNAMDLDSSNWAITFIERGDWDLADTGVSTGIAAAGGAAAVAATGAIAGATIGSSFPVVGTIIGAAIGAGVGGIIGFANQDHGATTHVFVIPEENIYNMRCEYLYWQEK